MKSDILDIGPISDVRIELGQHLLSDGFPISCGFKSPKNKSIFRSAEYKKAALDSLVSALGARAMFLFPMEAMK